MFRTALIILSGNAAASLLTLARNLLVARLISVEDYGIAATFAIAMTLVEMISALGLQQQIVQDKDGDTDDFQAGVQGFNLMRGVISGLVLYLAAGWIAELLHIPDAAWAYQLLALVPVINGLMHFDIYRLTRKLRYGPQMLTMSLPALVSLLVVWPLSMIWPDYRVMLIAILVQFGLMLLASHLTAERRFRVSFDTGVMGAAFRFGWPLLINNLMLFAVFNGDKLIVGNQLGLEELAILAMGYTLTLTPTLVMAKSAQNFFLPQLSAVQDDPARFQPLAVATLQAVLVMSLAFLLGVVLVGGPVVTLLLGEKYAALPPLLIGLGIMQTIRVMKAGGAIVALARGQTSNAMIANAFRIAVLPVAFWVAAGGGDLRQIVIIGILGEVLGLVASLALLQLRLDLSMASLRWPLLAALAMIVATGWYAWTLAPAEAAGFPAFGPALAVLGLFAVACWTMRPLQVYVRQRQMTKFGA